MYNKYTIKEEFELVETLKMLAQSYEEISVIKMQRVRSSVLSTRDFLDDLSKVFSDVKTSYQQELTELLTKKKKRTLNPLDFLSKKRKTAAVLLSSNTKLYGDIVMRVFNLFIEDIKKNNFDIVIIGRHGKALFDQANIRRRYAFFDLPDTGVDIENLKPIFNLLIDYERVYVYYGLFNNVVVQTPTVRNISGEQTLTSKAFEKQKITHYIFEPSLEKIFNFFRNQVLVALFKQTVHESELSRLASRIKAMEDALSNIEQTQKFLVGEQRKVTKLIDSKKQLETFSGIGLWKGQNS